MKGKELKDNLIDNTNYGKIRGYKTHNGMLSFKGIPYTEPPIKELRFSPPIPKKKWEGILDAKKFGPVAPQPIFR
ncbi:MAG: carboxylesterase family protein, partial [Promethearchaeota archaeon]